jgi:hypothetical protein
MTEDDFEPARRELCSDGGCIGLVGPDGRCKVCGTVSVSAVADPRHRGMQDPRGEDASGEDDLDEDRDLCPDDGCVGLIGPDGTCKVCGTPAGAAVEAASADPAGETVEVDGEDDRELCPDGSCVGLIGADGKCKVCGTPRSSTSS